MSPATQRQDAVASSGSDTHPQYANVGDDDRKRKRMISNRESARRSRMRKQKQVEVLVSEANQLQKENAQLGQQIEDSRRRFAEMDSANNVMRAQAMELTDRLRSLNSVLEVVEAVSGLSVDIQEIPDSLLEPWKLPCPPQLPIMASAAANDAWLSWHT